MDKIIKKKLGGVMTAGAVLFSSMFGVLSPGFAPVSKAASRPYLKIVNEDTLRVSGDGTLTAEMVNEVVPKDTEKRFRISKIVFDEDSQVTTLGKEVFAEFYGLKELTIPATVTSIGQYAFANDTRLETVISYSRASAKNRDLYRGVGLGLYETALDTSLPGTFKHKAIYLGMVASFSRYQDQFLEYVEQDLSEYNSTWFYGDTKIRKIKMVQNESMAAQLSAPYTSTVTKVEYLEGNGTTWDEKTYTYQGKNIYLKTWDAHASFSSVNVAKNNKVDLEFIGEGNLLAKDATGKWSDYFPEATVSGDVIEIREPEETPTPGASTSVTTDASGNASAVSTGSAATAATTGAGSENRSADNSSSATGQTTTGSTSSGNTTGTNSGASTTTSTGNNDNSKLNIKEEIEKILKEKDEADKKAKEESEKKAKEDAEKKAKEETDKTPTDDSKAKTTDTADTKAGDDKNSSSKTDSKDKNTKTSESTKNTKTGSVSVSTPKASASRSGKKITVNIKKASGAKKYMIQKYNGKRYVTIKTVKKSGKKIISFKTKKGALKIDRIRVIAVNGKIKKYSKSIKVKAA